MYIKSNKYSGFSQHSYDTQNLPSVNLSAAEILEFRDNALKAVAQKAINLKTGARGLRSVIENILLDTMFEIPGTTGVSEVIISGEVVEGKSPPLYIYAKEDEKKEKKCNKKQKCCFL